jgi:hypothetical protein|tara:strand:- start:162 stop:383 length:222 start_codon:yes stop_codon:yes gene_type:complete
MSKHTWESLAEQGHSPKKIEAMLDEQEAMQPKITGWKLVIYWDDETTEDVVDIPDWVAERVDEFLNDMEEQYV